MINPDLYNENYFKHCQGMKYFIQGEIDPIYYKAANKVNLKNRNSISVLDVGCGRGDLMKVLASQFPQINIIGIDYSDAAVRIAKEHLSKYLNINILKSDSADLPFKTNSIDYIFCLDVAEHLYPEHLDKTIKSIFRVLKPGGGLIIHTFPTRYINNIAHLILDFLNKDSAGKRMHVNTQSYFSMLNLLRNNLFKNITIHLEARDTLLQENIDVDSSFLKNLLINGDKLYIRSTRILELLGLKYLLFSDIWAYAEK